MRQPFLIRLTHWLNLLFLTLLIGSGLQIFNAHPVLYAADASDNQRIVFSLPQEVQDPGGQVRNQMVLFGHPIGTGHFKMDGFGPSLTVGGWLAGARRWHLTLMWLFLLNGLGYVFFLFASGEAKRRFFRSQDVSGLGPMIRYYVRRGPHPEIEGYNALQRLTYTAIVLMVGPLLILTGLAMAPQFDAHFPTYADLFGGRQFARTWHFALMLGIVAFSVLHVALVTMAGWPTFWAMVVGQAPRKERLHG